MHTYSHVNLHTSTLNTITILFYVVKSSKYYIAENIEGKKRFSAQTFFEPKNYSVDYSVSTLGCFKARGLGKEWGLRDTLYLHSMYTGERERGEVAIPRQRAYPHRLLTAESHSSFSLKLSSLSELMLFL